MKKQVLQPQKMVVEEEVEQPVDRSMMMEEGEAAAVGVHSTLMVAHWVWVVVAEEEG